MKFLFFCICIVLFALSSCVDSESDKAIKFREDQSKTVRSKIIDIKTEQILGFGSFCIVDSFLVFSDYETPDGKVMHLFNKNTYSYYSSFGSRGKGPGEITRMGLINVETHHSRLWVNDYAKLVRWLFPLDSIINNSTYLPTKKIAFSKNLFMEKMEFINDSIALGLAIKPLSASSAEMRISKLNLTTNKIEEFGYEHAGIKGKSTFSSFCIDKENKYYAKAYERVDLISVCNFNGNLIYNIYGPAWGRKTKERHMYFDGIQTYKGYIIAPYLGKKDIELSEEEGMQVIYPTKLLVFDLNGNYIKTILIGDSFSSFMVDRENGRAIMYFENRDNPLGYINLEL